MESTKTFTTRSNAKRNAVKAGLATSEIEIVSHGKGDATRFGWRKAGTKRQRDASLLKDVFLAPSKKGAPKKNAQPPERETRNGVKRPLPGTKCGAVWAFCDGWKKDTNSAPTPADARDWAERTGANANNAVIETYQWKRFMGYGKKAA